MILEGFAWVSGLVPDWSGVDYVLGPFEDREVLVVKAVLDRAVEGVETLLARGFDIAMKEINRKASDSQGEQ